MGPLSAPSPSPPQPAPSPPGAAGTVSRPLAATEAVFATAGTTITYYSLVAGTIDIAVLRRAYSILAHRNPVLFATIAVDGDVFTLRDGAPRRLPFWVSLRDPRRLFSGWALPVDQARELTRLDVAVTGGEATVGLTVHHAIADGRAGLALLSELWALYAESLSGRAIDTLVRPLPRPVEECLPAGPAVPADDFTDVPVSPLTGRPSVQDRFTVHLTAAETDVLAHYARDRGVSVHAVVTGAALVAEHRLSGRRGPELLLTSSAVDLRAALPEPMGPLDGTNIIAVVPDGIVVDHHTRPVEVGRAVVDRIRAEVGSGVAAARTVLADIDLPRSFTASPRSFVTNVGRVDDMATPPGVHITDLRFAFPHQLTHSLTYVVLCWQGRLRVDVLYPVLGLAPERARQLRTHLTAGLTELYPAPTAAVDG